MNIVLAISDYYYPILEKDMKNINDSADWLIYDNSAKDMLENSFCLMYQQDLMDTLNDLLKASSTKVYSIYNTDLFQIIYQPNPILNKWNNDGGAGNATLEEEPSNN